MKKIFLLIIALFVFAGCATFPPPEIVNGRYINPRYGFSIEVPDGWLQTEKAQTWLKDTLTEDDRSQIRIMFFNNETNGLICIMSDKTTPSVPSSALDENETFSFDNVIPGSFQDVYTYQPMKQEFEKRKQQLIKNSYIKNYSYKIYSLKKYTEKFSYETEFEKMEIRIKCMMYACQKDDTCAVVFFLITDIKTFNENYAVFNKVVDSFYETEYPPENKMKDKMKGAFKNSTENPVVTILDWIDAWRLSGNIFTP